MNDTGIDDRVKSRRGYKREEEASKRMPCRLSKAAHEEHEDGCEYLRGKIELVIKAKNLLVGTSLQGLPEMSR